MIMSVWGYSEQERKNFNEVIKIGKVWLKC